jgi:hypothetical protein
MDAISVITSRLLFPTHPAASSTPVSSDDAVDVVVVDAIGETQRDQPSRATSDMKLPPGWSKLADDYGVTCYVEPSTGNIQYTHPSLNAPPFAPNLTDYIMGYPAPDAPAWAWMLYLWMREVKSSHSVIGTLCAVSLCGRSLCSPPRDRLFQRRVTFRIYFMITSLLSSLLFQIAVMVMQFANVSKVDSRKVQVDQAIRSCNQNRGCMVSSIFIQFIFVSLPFGIFRCVFFII